MIKSMTCEAKTEHAVVGLDNDDITFYVIQRDSTNQVVEYKIPRDQEDFGFDDNETRADIELQDLEGMIWVGNGHATDFLVLVIEKDQKNNDELLAKARDYMQNQVIAGKLVTSNAGNQPGEGGDQEGDIDWEEVLKLLIEIGKAVGSAISENTDDVPGAFFVSAINDNGQIKCKFRPFIPDRSAMSNATSQKADFILSGDGAKYRLSVAVEKR
jgi:hypothetical protein